MAKASWGMTREVFQSSRRALSTHPSGGSQEYQEDQDTPQRVPEWRSLRITITLRNTFRQDMYVAAFDFVELHDNSLEEAAG